MATLPQMVHGERQQNTNSIAAAAAATADYIN
jgi:hypothetical protein